MKRKECVGIEAGCVQTRICETWKETSSSEAQFIAERAAMVNSTITPQTKELVLLQTHLGKRKTKIEGFTLEIKPT